MWTQEAILSSLAPGGAVKIGPNCWQDKDHTFKMRREGDGYNLIATKRPGSTFTMRDALSPFFLASRGR